MFGLFKRKDNKISDDFVYDQALIIRVPQANELGDEGALETIFGFEEEVEKKLPSKAGVDGHEFGDFEATIYLYGPSADEILTSSETIIDKYFSGQGAEVTLQYGLPDNPNTKEKKLKV